MPPEFHTRDKTVKYTQFEKHDVWAIGITAFNNAALKFPIDLSSTSKTLIGIISEAPHSLDSINDQNIRELILLMLQKDQV